ncbi:ParB/RepB/Spo0J family partition protein [Cellulomonas cellasea]|uniref:ParB/RepB/Spo0J family partition protein n=1 Tax=Cellulomonas cellasea TaxID=43670 RepID=UPI0025A33144|nr:ParB/RepB/Spo0J family partition protein [Cellulomonas cellasea]MDM8085185.1 ParB/RepB/Spo0J family partition protein [Cellulomonas cellasea]
MSEKRRGLGRGLGALIPTGLDGQRPSEGQRPVDVFFPDNRKDERASKEAAAKDAAAQATQATAEAEAVSRETATAGSGTSAPTVAPDHAVGTENGIDGGATSATQPGSEPTAQADSASASTTASEPQATATQAAQSNGAAADARAASDRIAPAGEDNGDDALLTVPGARFAELPVGSIRPNPRQPRTVFQEEALDELIGSIREIGVLQPIVVRPDGADGYELIMGERRWRATQAAGLDTIPAIVRDTEDSDLLRDALLENLHRSELNPLEEAAAYRQLLDDFGCTHEELATRIHRSRPQISNTLRLLRLPPLVQRRVAAGVLSAGHARALLGLTDGAAIERLAQRIVSEGLSVRAVEEIVSLGGEAAPARRQPRAGERNEALDELASRLSDRLDTRVKINLGKSRGRLTVEFASVQDLNRILESLTPDEPGFLRS